MSQEATIQQIITDSQIIVVVQADNPDGDSLASALALEHILADLGKKVHLYCGAEIPGYLRYLEGWDRVQNELPVRFDASIIVDTSAIILLEQLQKSGSIQWLKTKPCIVLDHHIATDPTIDFATVTHLQPAVSTGELLYELSELLSWKRSESANNLIMTSIMSDSMGLTSEATSARSVAIVSELVAQGVSIPALEDARRAMHKKSPELLKYKSVLLGRVEYSDDQQIAHVTIPWEEIEKYSHQYNPSVLVLDEMRMVTGVKLAVAFKTYPNGRITAKLRANYGFAIAAEVAKKFGGGGHPYAAGFKVVDGRSFNEVKTACLGEASQLLTSKEDNQDETTQYAYSVG
ncbi:MAG: DHH family phosphoesterase [Candidatus Saccharimonadales bacterium]